MKISIHEVLYDVQWSPDVVITLGTNFFYQYIQTIISPGRPVLAIFL